MKSSLLLFLFVCLFFSLKVFCIEEPTIIGSRISENSIIHIYDANGSYFSSWEFEKFNLNFACSISGLNRTCKADTNENNIKLMYNGAKGCYNDSSNNYKCSQSLLYNGYLPTPIVKPEFRPQTKGGNQIIEGYYLSIATFNQFVLYPSMKGIQIMDNIYEGFDPTHITLSFPSGCGLQTFKWPNGNFYNFSYQDPSIVNITTDGGVLSIKGLNFCNQISLTTVWINGKQINSNDILSADFEEIKIINHQIYSTVESIKIGAGVLNSIVFSMTYRPIPKRVNSVPKNKGGLVIIDGERLTTNNSSSKVTVKIGDLNCLNVVHTPTRIECDIGPLGSGPSIDLPITINIDGIENYDKSLLFSFDVPRINSFIPKQNGIIELRGECFGNKLNTILFVNGKKVEEQFIISEKEDILTFQLSSTKANVSISVGDKMSNLFKVDGSFYAIFGPTSSNNAQVINCTINNFNSSNSNSLPILKITGYQNITGTLIETINEAIRIYQFNIPKGCGRMDVNVTLGTQSCSSYYDYQNPIVKNCIVENDQVKCNGEFENYLIYSNRLKLNFLNHTLAIADLIFKRNEISFLLQPDYESSNLTIEMCGVSLDPHEIILPPNITSISGNKLNSTGGVVSINGKYFSDNNSKDTYLNCTLQYGNTTITNCYYNNSNLVTCNVLDHGPFDRDCVLIFGPEHKTLSSQKLIYYEPQISYYNANLSKTNSVLVTIYGSEFYNSINSINIGPLSCNNEIFIDSQTITCNLDVSSYEFSNQQLYYINVTINNKLGYSKIFNSSSYQSSNGEDSINNNSSIINGNNEKENQQNIFKKHKKLIISIIIVGFFLLFCCLPILSIFLRIKYNIYKKKRYLENVEKERATKLKEIRNRAARNESNFKHIQKYVDGLKESATKKPIEDDEMPDDYDEQLPIPQTSSA